MDGGFCLLASAHSELPDRGHLRLFLQQLARPARLFVSFIGKRSGLGELGRRPVQMTHP